MYIRISAIIFRTISRSITSLSTISPMTRTHRPDVAFPAGISLTRTPPHQHTPAYQLDKLPQRRCAADGPSRWPVASQGSKVETYRLAFGTRFAASEPPPILGGDQLYTADCFLIPKLRAGELVKGAVVQPHYVLFWTGMKVDAVRCCAFLRSGDGGLTCGKSRYRSVWREGQLHVCRIWIPV